MLEVIIITANKFGAHNNLHHQCLSAPIILVSDFYGGSDYPSNEIKTLAGITLARATWSLHIDHDTGIDLNTVHEYIKIADPTKAHGKILTGTYPPLPNLSYLSGPCFLLHRGIRRTLMHNIFFNQKKTGFGDVTLGKLYIASGIELADWPLEFKHHLTAKKLEEFYTSTEPAVDFPAQTNKQTNQRKQMGTSPAQPLPSANAVLQQLMDSNFSFYEDGDIEIDEFTENILRGIFNHVEGRASNLTASGTPIASAWQIAVLETRNELGILSPQ